MFETVGSTLLKSHVKTLCTNILVASNSYAVVFFSFWNVFPDFALLCFFLAMLQCWQYIHTASSSRRGVWQLGSAVNFGQLLFWQLSPSRGLHLPTWPLRLCSAAVALLPRLMICAGATAEAQGARAYYILYPTRLKWVHSRQLMYEERKTVQQRVSVWCCCYPAAALLSMSLRGCYAILHTRGRLQWRVCKA